MTNLKKQFLNPTNESRPRLRYWWPAGYVGEHLEELDAEIKSIAEAGFGGVEIADVYDAMSLESVANLEPKKYGFTSDNWKKAIKQALKSGIKYGVKIDLTVGPHWPASTNEATPNDYGTAKELVYGTYNFNESILAGTDIESLCPPYYKTKETMINGEKINNKLIGLYMAKQVDHGEIQMPAPVPWEEPFTVISDTIELATLTDITQYTHDNSLTSVLDPSFEKSLLIAIYERGTGQRVNMFTMGDPNRPDVMEPFAYVVDHFSLKGSQLVKSLWKKNFLNDPELVDLLKKGGENFFEDSLELQSVGHWTEDMFIEFQTRMGYSLKPYLPLVLGINQDKGLGIESSSFQVEDNYKDKVQKIRHDYFEVLNQLYREYHLQAMKKWANDQGMGYRAQPYGWAIDSAVAATEIDIPEGESLGFGEDGNDAFRMLACGRDFGGAKILSDEAGAYFGQGYATTLPQLFKTLQKNYMAGVNQVYWHGYPFKYEPKTIWPGFSAFNPMLGGRGFAEAWGDRQPVWQFMDIYTTYLARIQGLLRFGKSKVDVLLYQEGHNATENKQARLGTQLTQLGYTYQVMTEGLFDKKISVTDGNLSVANADYRLVLIPAEISLTDQIENKLLKWEKAGVPIHRIKNDNNFEELIQILGTSLFENATGELLIYERKGDNHDFLFVFNQGKRQLSLKEDLFSKLFDEWNPWNGQISTVRDDILYPNELRIFDRANGVEGNRDHLRNQNLEVRSLKELDWVLTLEKWEMQGLGKTETTKTAVTKKLDKLTLWSELPEFRNVSGVGTYSTHFRAKKGEGLKEIWIPDIEGSLKVTLNGGELSGNPIIGHFVIDPELIGENNHLEITVASTLNNYLNRPELVDHYSHLEQQKYGIPNDVLLLIEK